MYLQKEDSIVFIVDIQERLYRVMFQKEKFLNNCIKLLKGCQTLNLPMIATEQYPKGLGVTLPEIKAFLE